MMKLIWFKSLGGFNLSVRGTSSFGKRKRKRKSTRQKWESDGGRASFEDETEQRGAVGILLHKVFSLSLSIRVHSLNNQKSRAQRERERESEARDH